jgi:hypothetical protein
VRWSGPRGGVSRVACFATHDDVIGDGHLLKKRSSGHRKNVRQSLTACMHTCMQPLRDGPARLDATPTRGFRLTVSLLRQFSNITIQKSKREGPLRIHSSILDFTRHTTPCSASRSAATESMALPARMAERRGNKSACIKAGFRIPVRGRQSMHEATYAISRMGSLRRKESSPSERGYCMMRLEMVLKSGRTTVFTASEDGSEI